MSVTERLRAIGAWTLDLDPDTPRTVLAGLDLAKFGFGHVIVTPTRLDPTGITEANLLAKALYAGVYREHPSEFTIGGPGLAMWLGDEEDKGPIFDTAKIGGAQTFSAWIANLRPISLLAGTVTAIAGTLVQQFYLTTARKALDTVCDYFGGEWKITPDFKLHAGPQANLFATAPTVIVQRHDNGRDANVTGIDGTLGTALDLDDYTTGVYVLTRGTAGEALLGGATTPLTIPYRDPQGNVIDIKRLVDGSQVDAGNGNAVAATQVGLFDDVRRELTLAAAVYNVTGDITVGDIIWVHDPLLGLTDLANEVPYRGQTLHPVAVRVLGCTWPIKRGMGVFLRYWDGAAFAYLDLTEWVVFEDSAATVEIGATPRTFDDSSNPTTAQAAAPQFAQLADKSGHKNGATDGFGDITVAFTAAFPTGTDNVVVSPNSTVMGGTAVHLQPHTFTASSFKVRCFTGLGGGAALYASSTIDFYWQAKGR